MGDGIERRNEENDVFIHCCEPFSFSFFGYYYYPSPHPTSFFFFPLPLARHPGERGDFYTCFGEDCDARAETQRRVCTLWLLSAHRGFLSTHGGFIFLPGHHVWARACIAF